MCNDVELVTRSVQFTVTRSVEQLLVKSSSPPRLLRCFCRLAGSGRRRLHTESSQQAGHLQQGVDTFNHPHVSVTDLLEQKITTAPSEREMERLLIYDSVACLHEEAELCLTLMNSSLRYSAIG